MYKAHYNAPYTKRCGKLKRTSLHERKIISSVYFLLINCDFIILIIYKIVNG